MADVRKAFVRDGVVQSVYFDDADTIAAKLAPIADALVDCDETVQANWLYREGVFTDPATLIPPPTTRQKRRAEYFEALRVEVGDDQITVIGDQVDKILAQIEAIRSSVGVPRTAEFDALIKTIAAIKAKLPKPPPVG